MSSAATSPAWRPWIAPTVVTVLPPGLFVVLTFLRPDLIRPMLDHLFGYVLVSVTTVLSLLGGVLVGLWSLGTLESKGLRLTSGLLGVVGCTLPALFLILFGPIVFTFLFGYVP
jgi:hypothetical protein